MNIRSEILKEPDRFSGKAQSEYTRLRFRCPYCGIHQQAAVTAATPIEAKFRCTRCDNLCVVQTRASAMDSIEEWFNEGKDIRDTLAKKREWSRNVKVLVNTTLGPAYLID